MINSIQSMSAIGLSNSSYSISLLFYKYNETYIRTSKYFYSGIFNCNCYSY